VAKRAINLFRRTLSSLKPFKRELPTLKPAPVEMTSKGDVPMGRRLFVGALAATFATICGASALDLKLPAYVTVDGIAGRIKSVGSDTLDNEMMFWATGFMDRYSDVKIEVEGKGSATAPPALLDGVAQLGPMSRPMTADEVTAFDKKYGYQPTGFRVAVDALAIYVNKDNPITCLSIPQLGRIFSSSRKVPGGNDIKTWGDVGLTGEWAARPIVLYGRNSLSGTYEFFREMALYGGDFKQQVKEQVGSEAVVQNVASDKFAIGYSGIGFKTDKVRAVPVSIFQGGQCYDTSEGATLSGQYPIARYLYVYVNKKPGQPLERSLGEFIKYILSKDGQTLTERGGFYPISIDIREADLKKLGMTAN
jgi:phosphate transport system substrate-binding protein